MNHINQQNNINSYNILNMLILKSVNNFFNKIFYFNSKAVKIKDIFDQNYDNFYSLNYNNKDIFLNFKDAEIFSKNNLEFLSNITSSSQNNGKILFYNYFFYNSLLKQPNRLCFYFNSNNNINFLPQIYYNFVFEESFNKDFSYLSLFF